MKLAQLACSQLQLRQEEKTEFKKKLKRNESKLKKYYPSLIVRLKEYIGKRINVPRKKNYNTCNNNNIQLLQRKHKNRT